MDFGSGSTSKAKAWKDIWGCGQGINAIKEVQSTGDLVLKLRSEYNAARQRLLAI
jgi:nitronate monooxygenase